MVEYHFQSPVQTLGLNNGYMANLKLVILLLKLLVFGGVKQNLLYRFILGSKEHITQFIKPRAENDHIFAGAKNSASVAWR